MRIAYFVFVLLTAMMLYACTAMKSHGHADSRLENGKTSFLAKDYNNAYKQLLPLAEKGNADAQYAVGYMYFYGKGVAQNKEAAKTWLQKAAAQGEPAAIKALALIS